MAENIETITILKVDTGEAVQNIADLKNNIKLLQDRLKDTNQTFEQNQETVKELAQNQQALKTAMYGSEQTMLEITKAATDQGTSYNNLVKQMAKYKAQLRTINVDTEEGKKEFEQLASKINSVNDQLKEMDAMQGNYSRNVGNYKSALDGLHRIVGELPPSMEGVHKATDQLDKSFRLMSINPVLGVITFVAPLINKIADGLKDNEKATEALKKAMTALQPVMNLFEAILDKIADALTWVVDKVIELAGRSDGAFKKVVSGVTGVGNAIFQFLIAPVKTFIEVVKGAGNVLKDIFTGQWKNIKADAQAAGQSINDAIQKGWNFKQNYQAGESAADAFVSGLGSSRSKKKAGDAAKAIADEVKDEFDDLVVDLTADLNDILKAIEDAEQKVRQRARSREKEQLESIEKETKYRQGMNAAMLDDDRAREAESYRIQQEGNQRKLAALQSFYRDAVDRGDLDVAFEYEKQAADLGVQIQLDAAAEAARIRRQDVEDAERAAQSKARIMQEYAKGVGSVLGAIADLYDVNADKDKRSFENSKRFQIAETWVNTLSGMASAIWSTWNDKTIPSAIVKASLAATNAAGILASGIATTAKIRATQFGGGGTGSPTLSATAPAVATSLPQVLQAQTASDVDRLNRASEPSRVYILQSDIQAAGRAQKVRVAESTF